MIQFLYEGEYEPPLPHEPPPPRPERTTEGKLCHYEFPHTCERGCQDSSRIVCPHHRCGYQCRYNCKAFVCTTCQPPVHPAEGKADQLLSHAILYEIADKYDVKGLKELAREKFSRACAKFWDTEEFVAAAKHAWSTTPIEDRGLREVIIKTIAEHMNLLNKPDVMELLTEYSGLAVGVMELRARELGWLKE